MRSLLDTRNDIGHDTSHAHPFGGGSESSRTHVISPDDHLEFYRTIAGCYMLSDMHLS